MIVDENENILQVAAKSGLSSNHVTLDFISNTLVEDYRMCVRAVDEKTGSWHMYSLNLVEIVNEKPGRYNKKIAEQCALYSALAYKAVIKEDGKISGGFSYDTNTDFLSDKLDEEIAPKIKDSCHLKKSLRWIILLLTINICILITKKRIMNPEQKTIAVFLLSGEIR